MPLEFAGSAKRFDDDAIEAAAKKIGCPVAAVRAVMIIFERYCFCRLTAGWAKLGVA